MPNQQLFVTGPGTQRYWAYWQIASPRIIIGSPLRCLRVPNLIPLSQIVGISNCREIQLSQGKRRQSAVNFLA